MNQIQPKKQNGRQNGPVPVVPPSQFVQLTPIIQPIAFVPYSTQDQPLYTMHDGNDAYYPEDEVAYNQSVPYAAEASAVGAKKKVSVAAVFLMILSLLTVAALVLAKWVIPEFLAILGTEATGSGLDLILNFFENVGFEGLMEEGGMLVNVLMLGVGVFAVLTLLFALFRLKSTVAVITKIFALLMFVCGLAAVIFGFTQEFVEIGVGMYIVAALGALATIVAFVARRKR